MMVYNEQGEVETEGKKQPNNLSFWEDVYYYGIWIVIITNGKKNANFLAVSWKDPDESNLDRLRGRLYFGQSETTKWFRDSAEDQPPSKIREKGNRWVRRLCQNDDDSIWIVYNQYYPLQCVGGEVPRMLEYLSVHEDLSGYDVDMIEQFLHDEPG